MKKIMLAAVLLLSVPSTYAAQSVMFGYGTDHNRNCDSCFEDDSTYLTAAYRHYLKKQPFKKRYEFIPLYGAPRGVPAYVLYNDWSPYNRYGYSDSGLFIQGNITKWSNGDLGSDRDGTYIGVGAGYRSRGIWAPNLSRRWFLEGSVGIGNLDNPDGRHPDGRGRLTTSTQFQLTGGVGYRVTERVNIIGDYRHWSNGNSIFERSSKYSPNIGRDSIGITVEIKLGKQ